MGELTFELVSGGAGNTCAGGECPSVYKGSDGHYYIKGYIVPKEIRESLSANTDEDIVRIPSNLIEVK